MEYLVVVAVLLVLIVMVVLAAVRSLIVICPPNRVAVISGRNRAVADGRDVGYRVLKGGRTIRIPILERVDFMDLNTIAIDVSVSNAYSKGAIPLDVQGVANIKVSSREGILENSVERFLGRDSAFVQQIAKENLEANLRGVLSTLTPEEVNEDRLKFAQTLIDEADEDIRKLGLELDVLKIQNVTDQVGYLDAVGRRKTAQVLTEARESEAQQAADAEEAEALGRQRAELARVNSDLAIAEETNRLRVRQAELDATAIRENEAIVAGEKAKVTAEQELERERIELQRRRLEADVIAPAQAEMEAARLRADGEAAHIVADGAAQVDVLNLMTKMYKAAGTDAQNIFLLNLLPDLVDMISSTVAGIDVDKITVIDQGGGGGSGGGIPGLASQMPAAVISITEQIEAATGVNILSALQRTTSASGVINTTAEPHPPLAVESDGDSDGASAFAAEIADAAEDG